MKQRKDNMKKRYALTTSICIALLVFSSVAAVQATLVHDHSTRLTITRSEPGTLIRSDAQLSFRFSNAQILLGTPNKLQFDIQLKCDMPLTYLRDNQIFFNYNTQAFGTSIASSGKVTLEKIGILADDPGNPFNPLYNIATFGDNTNSRFFVATETNYPDYAGGQGICIGGVCFQVNREVPLTWVDYLCVSIDVLDGDDLAGIAFEQTLMNGGQYYTAPSSADPVQYFSPNLYDNDLLAQTLGGNIYLDVSVFLEGPFDGSQMTTMLNSGGYLWTFQPYNAYPWYYPGQEAVSVIPSPQVVDWVLVELRQTLGGAATATGETRIARQAGFLLSSGEVVSIDGSNPLGFAVTITEDLYVVIIHRNHLAVMSAVPLSETGGTYAYDFSTDAGQAYGAFLGHKQLVPGVWGMTGADGNRDGQIDNSDKNDVWVYQSGSSGYKAGDFSMDGQVNNVDKIAVWMKCVGRSSQVPA
ncbi:MAG: hypothetical protein JXA00_01215 [Candidatus Thermoplasmatota archaeon]|nr:hypothetical protein [Candidatus Thermoplasmatota archaeon]